MSDEENGGEPRIGREVTQMMKMLIEDRQRREEEIAREKEKEQQQERMQKQMEKLMELVEQSYSGSKAREIPDVGCEVKFARLNENDDIKAYLMTFKAHKVPMRQWVYKLAPQLTGKPNKHLPLWRQRRQTAIRRSRMSFFDAYNISEKMYRQWLRTVK